MKLSIESDRIPVPLFFEDRLIVSMIFPGRKRSCVLVGATWWFSLDSSGVG